MAENFSFAEFVIPGTYVRVRADALISAGGIAYGNIGIVGTAASGIGETHTLSDYESAKTAFGAYDPYAAGAGTHNLTRSLELLFQNGARTIYARGLAAGANEAAFTTAFSELLKENVNILVAPELETAAALRVLGPLLETAENSGKDLLGVIGSDASTVSAITGEVPANDRVVFAAPGIQAFDAAAADGVGAMVSLNGRYTAAAVAGLIASLTPESSPTNKALPGVQRLAQRFSYAEMKDLVNGRVMVLEERRGVRVVRGLTTDEGAFSQVTTRRITDFAKAGIRRSADPFIGRLNNTRIRKALEGAIDGFLTTMVMDEQLTSYNLEVTATRQDEIAGRALVNAVLQPTFSIDFIAVTLVLQ